MTAKVFVGNLDFGTTRQSLEGLFAPIGEIVDLALPVDRDTGRPRGFAFVTFSSEASATEAIRRLDGVELNGRNLRVSEATPSPGRRGGPRADAPGGDAPQSDLPQDFGQRPGRGGGFGRPKGSRRGLRGRKRSL